MTHYKRLLVILLIFSLLVGCVSCLLNCTANEPRVINLTTDEKISLISDIHRYATEKLGLEPTSNCSVFNPDMEGYDFVLCASVFRIPFDYNGEIGIKGPCDDKYVFTTDAVAASIYGKNLLSCPLARICDTVFHEIWHGQTENEIIDSSIDESMAMLIGFASAISYTKEKFGEDTDVYRDSKSQIEEFLRFSNIINAANTELDYLYQDYWAGKISQQVALQKKQEILKRVGDVCLKEFSGRDLSRSLRLEPNNASIGFYMTYTRYFPSAYKVYMRMCQEKGNDLEGLRATIKIFRAIPESVVP